VADQPKKRSLFHRAFWNQYNFILLGAAALFSVVTFTWVPLMLGAGAEALWLFLGADSSPFKRWVAIQESQEDKDRLKQQAEVSLAALNRLIAGASMILLWSAAHSRAAAETLPRDAADQGEMDAWPAAACSSRWR
jgi:hypothetical protein